MMFKLIMSKLETCYFPHVFSQLLYHWNSLVFKQLVRVQLQAEHVILRQSLHAFVYQSIFNLFYLGQVLVLRNNSKIGIFIEPLIWIVFNILARWLVLSEYFFIFVPYFVIYLLYLFVLIIFLWNIITHWISHKLSWFRTNEKNNFLSFHLLDNL